MAVSNAAFTVNETVAAMRGTLPQLIPKHNEVLDTIKLSLVDPVFVGNTREAETQTLQSTNIRPDITDPLISNRPRTPPGYVDTYV